MSSSTASPNDPSNGPSNGASRYQLVSRRALLRSSVGAGFAAVVAASCGNQDAQVFAGSVASPVAATATSTTTTSTTTAAPETTSADPTADAEQGGEAGETELTETVAVAGEMVIAFTFTQGAGGLNENPYVAVWIEDAVGDLATTVALYYEQDRRGARWLDHLHEWFDADAERIAEGGADTAATISSATRAAGEYLVAWDGLVDGVSAPAGDYFICIESVREEGPLSLIREPVTLDGSLPLTNFPDDGELSGASVLINV